MKKTTFLISFLLSTALLAFEDYDLDGVEDIFDECPNSLITDLVDIDGCTIRSLQNPHRFDMIVGINYAEVKSNTVNLDTTSTSLQVDYYYNKFSFQLSTAYLSSSNDSYLGDTYLASYYNFSPSSDLEIRVGLGAILPTYNSTQTNNLDYLSSFNLSYSLHSINIFSSLIYTVINDESSDKNIEYQDILTYNLGLGFYPSSKLYSSISYNSSQNTIKTEEDLNSLSLYNFYSIDESWFTTFNYEYSLHDSTNAISLKVGYYF